jgi:hypothetical protein
VPSTIAADVRGALKTALAPLAANIYDSVPESVIVPAIVMRSRFTLYGIRIYQ